MKHTSIRLSLSLVLSLTVGCLGADDSTGRGVDEVCGAPSDCASGLECEFEHGVGTCQPHGGSSDGGARDAGRSEASASDAGTSSTGCATNADCASGLECEVEHGAGACQPHGGRR